MPTPPPDPRINVDLPALLRSAEHLALSAQERIEAEQKLMDEHAKALAEQGKRELRAKFISNAKSELWKNTKNKVIDSVAPKPIAAAIHWNQRRKLKRVEEEKRIKEKFKREVEAEKARIEAETKKQKEEEEREKKAEAYRQKIRDEEARNRDLIRKEEAAIRKSIREEEGNNGQKCLPVCPPDGPGDTGSKGPEKDPKEIESKLEEEIRKLREQQKEDAEAARDQSDAQFRDSESEDAHARGIAKIGQGDQNSYLAEISTDLKSLMGCMSCQLGSSKEKGKDGVAGKGIFDIISEWMKPAAAAAGGAAGGAAAGAGGAAAGAGARSLGSRAVSMIKGGGPVAIAAIAIKTIVDQAEAAQSTMVDSKTGKMKTADGSSNMFTSIANTGMEFSEYMGYGVKSKRDFENSRGSVQKRINSLNSSEKDINKELETDVDNAELKATLEEIKKERAELEKAKKSGEEIYRSQDREEFKKFVETTAPAILTRTEDLVTRLEARPKKEEAPVSAEETNKKIADAILQLENVLKVSPNNKEAQRQLDALKAKQEPPKTKIDNLSSWSTNVLGVDNGVTPVPKNDPPQLAPVNNNTVVPAPMPTPNPTNKLTLKTPEDIAAYTKLVRERLDETVESSGYDKNDPQMRQSLFPNVEKEVRADVVSGKIKLHGNRDTRGGIKTGETVAIGVPNEIAVSEDGTQAQRLPANSLFTPSFDGYVFGEVGASSDGSLIQLDPGATSPEMGGRPGPFKPVTGDSKTIGNGDASLNAMGSTTAPAGNTSLSVEEQATKKLEEEKAKKDLEASEKQVSLLDQMFKGLGEFAKSTGKFLGEGYKDLRNWGINYDPNKTEDQRAQDVLDQTGDKTGVVASAQRERLSSGLGVNPNEINTKMSQMGDAVKGWTPAQTTKTKRKNKYFNVGDTPDSTGPSGANAPVFDQGGSLKSSAASGMQSNAVTVSGLNAHPEYQRLVKERKDKLIAEGVDPIDAQQDAEMEVKGDVASGKVKIPNIQTSSPGGNMVPAAMNNAGGMGGMPMPGGLGGLGGMIPGGMPMPGGLGGLGGMIPGGMGGMIPGGMGGMIPGGMGGLPMPGGMGGMPMPGGMMPSGLGGMGGMPQTEPTDEEIEKITADPEFQKEVSTKKEELIASGMPPEEAQKAAEKDVKEKVKKGKIKIPALDKIKAGQAGMQPQAGGGWNPANSLGMQPVKIDTPELAKASGMWTGGGGGGGGGGGTYTGGGVGAYGLGGGSGGSMPSSGIPGISTGGVAGNSPGMAGGGMVPSGVGATAPTAGGSQPTNTPVGKGQAEMMKSVYSSFTKAGFSENQAKALAAEVGRENDYNPDAIYGSHTDAANGAKNTGFFSWQGDRAKKLEAHLASKGLMKDGKMTRSQESLDEMAKFSKSEMESGQYKGLGNFLENKNVDPDTAAKQVGKGYIKWAYGQDTLKNGTKFNWRKHDNKRAGYQNKLDEMVKQDPSLTKNQGDPTNPVSPQDPGSTSSALNQAGQTTTPSGKTAASTGQAGAQPAQGQMQPVAGTAGQMPSLVKYNNKGATRNKAITGNLDAKVSDAVRNVYGEGYTAELYSGGQDRKGQGKRRTGSTRHDDGKAGDFYIRGPDGQKIQGDDLGKLGQYWTAKGNGGVGMEMKGGGVHLDEHTDRARTWDYRKDGGRLTPAQAKAMQLGKQGIMPELASGANGGQPQPAGQPQGQLQPPAGAKPGQALAGVTPPQSQADMLNAQTAGMGDSQADQLAAQTTDMGLAPGTDQAAASASGQLSAAPNSAAAAVGAATDSGGGGGGGGGGAPEGSGSNSPGIGSSGGANVGAGGTASSSTPTDTSNSSSSVSRINDAMMVYSMA